MPIARTARQHGHMTNNRHALVWIDHHLAKVFLLGTDTHETLLVSSTHPHSHLHHKANSIDSGRAPVDKDFLRRVAATLMHVQSILIAGPASAKIELTSYLESAHPRIAARVSAVETMDHPTDGELLAHARHFFKADDRMRLQV
jgi:stalled ribosome rescue protein Dom34